MWPNPQATADLVTFTEESLNGKFHFCAVRLQPLNVPTVTELTTSNSTRLDLGPVKIEETIILCFNWLKVVNSYAKLVFPTKCIFAAS